ncbi:MAG: 5,6-dimethylbenzimidazole synthase [Planctomycetota bacterium]
MTEPTDFDGTFPDAARRAVYEAIARRRDVRTFRPDPVPDDVLARILIAASQAPSVGYSQPWSFLVLRDEELRGRIARHVEEERLAGADVFEGERRDAYLDLKLEGILDAPLNLLVTCDRERFGTKVLGRNTILEADVFSVVCAVQNLMLAARAEGVGVGWVTLLREEVLRELVALPETVVPIAYLCVGYPERFRERPKLETTGWLPRLDLKTLVHEEHFGAPLSGPLGDELDRADTGPGE